MQTLAPQACYASTHKLPKNMNHARLARVGLKKAQSIGWHAEKLHCGEDVYSLSSVPYALKYSLRFAIMENAGSRMFMQDACLVCALGSAFAVDAAVDAGIPVG